MIGSAYVSRQLEIHPSQLAPAAAEWHRNLQSIQCTRHSVRLNHHVWLAEEPQASKNPLQLYGVRGILWVGPVPVRVELEFSKWSETVSEVGLHPASISWPVGSNLYERRAVATFDDIAQALLHRSRSVEDRYHPLSLPHKWHQSSAPYGAQQGEGHPDLRDPVLVG